MMTYALLRPACYRQLVALAPLLLLAACAAPQKARSVDATPREAFVRVIPDATEYVPLLQPPTSVQLESGLVVLQPGDNCGWHSTENYEEMVICLAGSGEIRSDHDERQTLSAGHYAYNPPRVRHCIFNTGTDVMRYIYVVTPTADH
jgi:quercetin dioxygenase-like cupin family protein